MTKWAFVVNSLARKNNETLELAQLDEAESAGKPLQIFELIIFN